MIFNRQNQLPEDAAGRSESVRFFLTRLAMRALGLIQNETEFRRSRSLWWALERKKLKVGQKAHAEHRLDVFGDMCDPRRRSTGVHDVMSASKRRIMASVGNIAHFRWAKAVLSRNFLDQDESNAGLDAPLIVEPACGVVPASDISLVVLTAFRQESQHSLKLIHPL